jgi:membrane-anchored mycosin MYCP
MKRRSAAAFAATLGLLGAGIAPAAAVTPPAVDPGARPPGGAAGPVQPMEQRSPCVTTGVVAGSDPAAVTANQVSLDLTEAWKHSRGDGQTVAVIDTGVKPGPRLPAVEPGGDFVASGDGLADCDGRGTMVAGLIAGAPGADGFSGVAPAARILAIRQTSARYSPRNPGGDPAVARAAVDVQTLARAIVRAADLGARVITIPGATCLPAAGNIDQSELGAALRYAAVDKDAVIVAAAGDTDGASAAGSRCEANPLSDPARPADPRNWAGVTSLSIPAWWQPFVLTVGALGTDGRPSPTTMAGPWLGVAAPGHDITSVSNDGGGGLANGAPNRDQQLSPVSGTAYAAAYVAGVAALVRNRFPDLTAPQVVDRITATAHGAARSPSNLVGSGGIDPVAALTWNVDGRNSDAPNAVREVPGPPAPAAVNPVPRIVAFSGAGLLTLLVLITAVVRAQRKDSSS